MFDEYLIAMGWKDRRNRWDFNEIMVDTIVVISVIVGTAMSILYFKG